MLKINLEVSQSFSWKLLVKKTAISFRLDEREVKSLEKTKVAKLIGLLPFIAGCDHPERTALHHLATYLIAAKGAKEEFFHNVEDNEDILKRLEGINHFVGGDQKILEKGMKLLALVMVHDYKRDIEEDRLKGKYNPITDGAWSYHLLVDQLTEDVNSIYAPEIDIIYKTQDTPFLIWRKP